MLTFYLLFNFLVIVFSILDINELIYYIMYLLHFYHLSPM